MRKSFTSNIHFLNPITHNWLVLLLIVCISVQAHALSYTKKTSPLHSESILINKHEIAATILAGEQVVSFTLVNADTRKDIQTLANGATLNLATLPTKNLNIRANTNPTTVGSVVLALSGQQTKSITENMQPYELMGDNGAWTPVVGSYALKATPYSASKGSGTAGTALTINFKVVNSTTTSTSSSQQVISFTLVNADTKKDIQTLANGATLNLATLPTKNLNIRANTNPSTVGSVVFALSGQQIKSVTENMQPYELMGDNGAWTPAVGSYTLKATPYSASQGSGTAGTALTIAFSVTNAGQTVKVNFQDPATVPPTGWVRDYGQPFGTRTGPYQGTNLMYGWKKRSDKSLLDLSVGGTTPGNGRNRGIPSDVLAASLMHMQADDIAGTFNGTKTEGYWELKTANGMYDVTVSAGDAAVHSFPERHSIEVEGVKAITDFVPSGAAGTATRFKSAKVRVSVTDGYLTVNADGGFNTKINSVQVVPVTSNAYVYWSANSQSLTIEQGSTSTTKTFSLDLSNSLNRTDITYTLSAVYGSGGSGWLTFNASHAASEPNVTFNYSAASKLPVGTYQATVTAAAAGYTSGNVAVQVNVVMPQSARPYVISSTPPDGAKDVSVNTSSIAANNLHVPEVSGYKGGVDNSTITNSTVKLLKMLGTSSTEVMGVVQGTGGGDAISFSPSYALEPYTTYKFMVTDGVKSYSGASFIPYTATFTTGATSLNTTNPLNVSFTKVPIAGTQNKKYASLTFGPDGKLYALRLDGVIERFTVNRTDGSLSEQVEIRTLMNKYGPRTAIGLAFDPAATATNLILWVSHSSSGLQYAPEFDGNISKLSGPNLIYEQLVITKLPRSSKDHMVNSLAFGPDGGLYIAQGANGSMGDYDSSWKRIESLLSAAVLRLDIKKLSSVTLPLDVLTTTDLAVIKNAPTTSMRMSDGSYNPYGSSSPLTIYASGVRNAYDLVWHSNGQLYAPTNGSAAGGNTPASVAGTRRPDGTFYNGPVVPATLGVQVQNDWLFRINPLKPIGYYGHPNPFRGEYVANRGYVDNNLYPSTMGPDANYRNAAFNFEFNRSPNGVLEYKSSAFNGALRGKLLVCRFSGGGDIMVLNPGSLVKGASDDRSYDIVSASSGGGTNGLVGMSDFANPLDITEDVVTGNLYVIEFNWNNSTSRTAQITLLRVSDEASLDGLASVYPMEISASEAVGTPEEESKHYAVTIANTGKGNLKVKGIHLAGTDAHQFKVKGAPGAKANKPVKIPKNSSVTFNVAFTPSSKGVKKAKLQIEANKHARQEVDLTGMATLYEEEDDSIEVALAAESKPLEIARVNHKETANQERVLKVYPNPTPGDRVHVEIANFGKQEKVKLTLYDVAGRAIKTIDTLTDEQGTATADMQLTQYNYRGTYIIRAQAPSGSEQLKLLIE